MMRLNTEKNSIDQYVLSDGGYVYFVAILFGQVLTTSKIDEAVKYTDIKIAITERDFLFETFNLRYNIDTYII